MGQAENYVEGYLAKKANELGFYCCKFTSPSNAGVPDRVLIGHGRTFFVETKAPGQKARPLQLAVHAKMRAYGAEIYVIDSRKEVDALLQSIIDSEGENN